MSEKTKESYLVKVSQSDYGDLYQQHLFDQYKMLVESTHRVSRLRITANNYLLTVNAFLVTLYGITSALGQTQAWSVLVSTAGIFVCFSWYVLILNYRNLNKAKFEVIHELEKHLPAAMFNYEWEMVERGRGKAYKPLTHIEQRIPLIFLALYLILSVISVVSYFLSNSS